MTTRLRRRLIVVILVVLALAGGVVIGAPMVLGGERYQTIPATGHFDGTVALFVSGDAGPRLGTGKPITQALAARGIPVLAISSPTAFHATRTRAQVDAVLAEGVRRALATPGMRRLILIGQSFGADMLATTAPDLPPDLRRRVAAIILVVPARTVYFRSDALGFAYSGAPDALPAAGMRRLDWAPVLCIQGVEEADSLCPLLVGTPATRVALPGGHFLHHDEITVVVTILERLWALGL